MNEIKQINDEKALEVFRFIEDAKACKTRKEFKVLMESLKGIFYFERFAVSLMDFTQGKATHLFIIQTFPKLWIAEYMFQNFDRIDPIFLRNFDTATFGVLQVWEDTYRLIERNQDLNLLKKQLKFIAASKKYSVMQSGMTIGSNNKRYNSGFIFSVFGKEFQAAPSAKLIFTAISPFVEEALQRVRNHEVGSQLTEHQIKVLDLVQQGKKRKQIAIELEVAENTVKYHLEQISQRLKVNSQAHAVAKGLTKGIIPFR